MIPERLRRDRRLVQILVMDQPSGYRGGCHCGQIIFEVDGPIDRASECNCSICTMKGYIHWIVPRERFRLLTPPERLATYSFNTHTARHHFCPRCGVAAFYVPRSDPDKIDVNLRCVRDIDLEQLELTRFDGRNWESAIGAFVR